jgi:hypothetical protein
VDKWDKQHEGNNTIHFIIAGNLLFPIPEDEGADSIDALLERVKICYFTREFDRKGDIAEEIVNEERKGILAWMVAGAINLVAENGKFRYRNPDLMDWLAESIRVAKYVKLNYDIIDQNKTKPIFVTDFLTECNDWLTLQQQTIYVNASALGKDIKLLRGVKRIRNPPGMKKGYYYIGLIPKGQTQNIVTQQTIFNAERMKNPTPEDGETKEEKKPTADEEAAIMEDRRNPTPYKTSFTTNKIWPIILDMMKENEGKPIDIELIRDRLALEGLIPEEIEPVIQRLIDIHRITNTDGNIELVNKEEK